QVYTGDAPEADGSSIFLEAARLNQSVNSRLVMDGLAYVEPYDTMPITLVQNMRQVIATARQNQAGLFPSEDVSVTSAATIADIEQLQGLVMWPKLFRR